MVRAYVCKEILELSPPLPPRNAVSAATENPSLGDRPPYLYSESQLYQIFDV